MVDHERLARVLIEHSRVLVTDYSVMDVLYRLCDHVTEILPVTGAGVMLEDNEGLLRFVAASDERIRDIEALQIELGEGPCVRAYVSGEQVVVPDLEQSPLFPRFGVKALERGLRAVYSFPMRVADERVGALNLYRSEPGEFDEHDTEAAQVLADAATVAILNGRALEESQRLATQLQQALDSRVIIEQAKGKLGEQLGVDVDAAFRELRAYARGRGLRLRDVARAVVEGELRLDEATGEFRRPD